MPVRVLWISVLLMFMLVGCSTKDTDEHAKAASGEPQHVWSGQVKALDQARQLEKDMGAAYKKNAEQIEQQAR